MVLNEDESLAAKDKLDGNIGNNSNNPNALLLKSHGQS